MEVCVKYKLLGPTRALRDGESLPLGGPKQRAVLAVLLLSHGRVVEFDAMIDAVWNGVPPVKAISSVRAYVANLRRVLGQDALITTSYGYRLELGPSELDVDRFEALASEGRSETRAGHHSRACELLSESLGVWTGSPLEDLRDLDVAAHETDRLHELRADIVETYFDCRLTLGHHVDIVGPLEHQIVLSPLRERLWWQLMLALYRANRRVDALRAFGRATRLLHDELGIEPGPALKSLDTEIRRESTALSWQEEPGARGAPRAERPPLFGREAELRRVEDALAAARGGVGRVVVLVGDSGSGKTSIAGEAVANAESAGFTTAWSCPPDGMRQPSLWSWVQVLRVLGDNVGRGQLARAAEVIEPGLLEMLPGWPVPSTARSDSRADFLVLDSVVLALHRLVEGHPTLVVLDDLDRADRASREVLQLVVGNLRQLPLVVVASWSAHGAGRGPGRSSLGRLTNTGDSTVLRLGPLTVEAIGRMLEREGVAGAGGELAGYVHHRTAGNPYYATEVIRSLIADPGMREKVPESVSASIRDCVSRLPKTTSRELRTAAVRTDNVILLRGKDVESAIAAGLVVYSADSGGFAFVCPLVRDAIAEHSSRTERVDAARLDATRLVRVASTSPDRWQQQLTTG